MAEVDLYQVAGLVLSVLGPLAIVVLANGHYAREFEKQKKKYEVKLERYSVVALCLQLLLQATQTMHSFQKLVEDLHDMGFSDARENSESSWTELQALSRIKVLKESLDLEITEEYRDVVGERFFLGVRTEEAEKIGDEQATDKATAWMDGHFCDVLRCVDIIKVRLNKGVSDLRVIGQKSVADRVEDLTSEYLNDNFEADPWMEPPPTEIKWRPRIDGMIETFAKNLEETL